MHSKEFVKVKRPIKPAQNFQPPLQTAPQDELVSADTSEIEQPEQSESTVQIEPVAEIQPDE